MSRAELVQIIEMNPRLQPRTRVIYRRAVDRWIAFSGDDSAGWTPLRAQAFYNDLLSKNLKPQSANLIIHALRHVFGQWAEVTQEPRRAIFRAVQTRKDEPPEQAKVLSDDEGQRLANVRRGVSPLHLRDFAIVVLGLQTGMRRMSFCGATLEGLSYGDRILKVPVKGGTSFPVPLSRAALEALKPWVAWLRRQQIETGALFWSFRSPRLDHPGTFPQGPISLPGFDVVIQRIARDASVENVSPHSFRHTFVTWARQAGVAPFQIAAVTGHVFESSVGGTDGLIENVYTRRSVAHATAAEAISRPWMFRQR